MLTDNELLRYSRHIMLPQVDINGQEALKQARVLVIGVGGLGCPVAQYLAAAGVGHLTLCDDDEVELSNLQRQVLHTEQSVGRNKAESASEALARINPLVTVDCIKERLSAESLQNLITRHDVVVDCTDNFASRYIINDACQMVKKPLVSGAAIRFEGQVSVFTCELGSPCYRCLYDSIVDREESCSETGVAAPIVGVIGSLQAMEVCKLLWQTGEPLSSQLLLVDGLTMSIRKINILRDENCSTCGAR